ncbi:MULTISPECIES: fimbrial protein [Lachnospiraceae]|uniref:fimbrial protein n=1 Tax=Lachnospiraceae TaxID=186803 RepID=UPI0039A163BC
MKQLPANSSPEKKWTVCYGKYLYAAFLLFTLVAANVQPVLASNMWDKANEIMKDVYNQIVLISTIAAVVTASVALLLMNFSKSGKTVDESRAWLKRIIITWAILNGLGFIMAYITPFFAGGTYSG